MNPPRSVSSDCLLIDTCQGSLLHLLLRAPSPGTPLNWKLKTKPFLIAAFLFGVLPTGITMVLQKAWWNPMDGLEFPVFRDFSVLSLSLITLPLCIAFLWSEKALIAQKLVSIHSSGVLRPKQVIDLRTWEARFKHTNLFAQIVGIATGLGCSYAIYIHWLNNPAPIGTWQVDANNHILISGWIFLGWQIPIFWAAVILYIFRAALTQSLLRTLVRISDVTPQPFHPDRAGGLSDVARIGLRNQFLLAAAGVQLVCAIFVFQFLRTKIPGLANFLTNSMWICIIAYVLAGPFVFVAPLLPFRNSMREKKTSALAKLGAGLQKLVDQIITQLPNTSPTDAQDKEIERYKTLINLVEREPVWPFDVVTLRRFFSAYLLPFLAWLLALSPISETLVHLAKQISSP